MKTPEQHEQEMMDRYRKSISGATSEALSTNIVCPQYYDKECVLCNLTHQYYKTFKDKNHFMREKARNLNRKLKYYMNVILPANPSEVVVFECGSIIFEALWGTYADEGSEYKGYTDPVNGRSFFIKKDVPPGNKRQTKYTIEMRSQPSPIPDQTVLQRMNNLDTIVELMANKQVKVFYHSQLPEGRTEMRVLPSWLGPKYKKFYVEVPMHFMNRDEFDGIQAGKVNPFAEVGVYLPGSVALAKKEEIIVSPQEVNPWVAKPTEVPQPVPTAVLPPFTPSTAPVTPVAPTTYAPVEISQEKTFQPTKSEMKKPICWGTFEGNSPLCTVRCKNMGFADDCARESALNKTGEKLDQNEELRRTAARLYKQ